MNENAESSKPNERNPFIRFCRKVTLGCGTIYTVVILFLVLNETSLVYPGAHGESNWEPEFEHRDVWVDSSEGARIHGWYLPRNNANRYVLLHHGNGEDVAQVSQRYARKLGEAMNANVLVYDYRGFGKSEGSPHETGVIDDGEAMLKWLLKESKLEKASDGVYYFGSSLGGGVAVGLAERHPPKYLILDRTFDAITTAGAKRYPWVPVKLMMRNRFNSLERIENLDVPLYQSHFTHDELCGLDAAKKLFDAAPTSDKTFHEIAEGGHYDALPDSYWNRLADHFAIPTTTDADPATESAPDSDASDNEGTERPIR